VLPVLDAYAPELVLVSAGFDAHKSDPLAGMQLDASAYGWMTTVLGRAADKSAAGKLALFLEGGYDLPALEASLADALASLIDASRPVGEAPPPERVHEGEILRTRKALREHWRDLA
jgi:acetoin utilization deacetylase AcuC-like enzyme